MIARVKTLLARYKAPKRVAFVAEVPRAANGKVDYKRARQNVLVALATASST